LTPTTGDTFRILLTNGAPSPSWSDDSEVTSELTTANGYMVGGEEMVTTSASQTSGVFTWVGTDVGWTLTGEISFQYAILNDVTADLLVGWWDYGSAQTPSTSLTLTIGTLLTVSYAWLDILNLIRFDVMWNPRAFCLPVLYGDTEIFRAA
jgi:hypothetical protein